MLPNVSVAPNRKKLTHYVLLAATGCTHLVALYWLMVLNHKKHVMPSSGEVKTKSHLFSCLVLAGSECRLMCCCSKQEHLLALYWLMVFIHETHVIPSSGKVKTKRHLFSYLLIAGSEFCPMCQLLQTETNYHITYIWLVLVAPIFWHYIDWCSLFMKHMWCHLGAKYKQKGICSNTWFLQAVS